MNLRSRIERIERKQKPPQLRAVIEAFLAEAAPEKTFVPAPLAVNDPRLQQGVNDDAEAAISRWWLVTFFDGTQEKQNERLRQLRQDPTFQQSWSDDASPVYFEGNAGCEDAYARIHKRKHN